MIYDFKNLSFADFEDLARDLIGEELGIRFEAFCSGPDGGIDGRHAAAEAKVILQAKHYEGSPFSKLKSIMKQERKAIDALAPTRYLLATSCKFSPPSKADLAAVIGPSLKTESDIFGPEDINALLRKYPEILRAHIKLWLSGAAVLDRIVRSAAHGYAAITREEIEQKVRIYARNPSFDQSLSMLEKQHLLIISGPPGVGKTTLADMLCYTFLSNGWELVPIRSLEDGFAAIDDRKKQIFLFDDFLGRVALDKHALAHKDSDLARFMSRIQRSPNARFVLTTRGYIFEEARRISEHLGDEKLDVTKYILDVGVYTRRIKALILYNHLLAAKTPKTHIQALLESDSVAAIIDHRNYNPRVIEAMTDVLRIGEIEPAKYPATFLSALKNPGQIWDTAFRTHIDHRCRHLLFAMFFLSEYNVSITELRVSFDALHGSVSKFYGLTHGPKDYEEALRILEGSFVGIKEGKVSFVNPSLKDFLSTYLCDPELLCLLAPLARSVDWIANLWHFVERSLADPYQQERIARSCIGLIDMFEKSPRWKPKRPDGLFREHNDAANSKRLELLFDWWQITDDIRFADAAIRVATNPQQGFSPWADSEMLIEFFTKLGDGSCGREFIYKNEFLAVVEEALIDLIRRADTDDLCSIIEMVDKNREVVPQSVEFALKTAVFREFDNVSSRVSEEVSESSLTDYIDALSKFARHFCIPDTVLQRATFQIENRIAELEEGTVLSAPPSVPPAVLQIDRFDNHALKNLFSLLLAY